MFRIHVATGFDEVNIVVEKDPDALDLNLEDGNGNKVWETMSFETKVELEAFKLGLLTAEAGDTYWIDETE